MVDTGIVAVGNEVVNIPLLPMLACWLAAPMATVTFSPAAGNEVPLLSLPARVTVAVPKVIDCEGVNALNVNDASACTVTLAMERICWFAAVTVLALM